METSSSASQADRLDFWTQNKVITPLNQVLAPYSTSGAAGSLFILYPTLEPSCGVCCPPSWPRSSSSFSPHRSRGETELWSASCADEAANITNFTKLNCKNGIIIVIIGVTSVPLSAPPAASSPHSALPSSQPLLACWKSAGWDRDYFDSSFWFAGLFHFVVFISVKFIGKVEWNCFSQPGGSSQHSPPRPGSKERPTDLWSRLIYVIWCKYIAAFSLTGSHLDGFFWGLQIDVAE